MNHFSKVCLIAKRAVTLNSWQVNNMSVKTVTTPDQSVETMHAEKGDSDNSEEYTFAAGQIII